MESIKSNVNELMRNQTNILEAIKFLINRVDDIIEKKKNFEEVENIVKSQTMIDELIVNNADDISRIKKTQETGDKN